METDTGSERVLEFYGNVSDEQWFADDITPKMFHDELFAGTGPVTLWLSSPGGDVIAASQIYAMLMDYPGDVTVKIDGIAASAASVIAMAGTRVLMAPTAYMFIHNPITVAYGNQEDMEKTIKTLVEIKEGIISAYEIKTGLSRAVISHLMDADTLMHAGEAVAMGFADGLLEDKKKTCKDDASAKVSIENRLPNMLKVIVDGGKIAKAVNREHQAASEPKAEPKTQPEPAAEPAAPEGTPISDLEKRLNLLKP